jgi:predicted Ser/Thr protein kinase/tetratricopeptide (TPR) repeat protein
VDLNHETLSEWPIGGHDVHLVDVDDQELDLELDRLKRSLGLDPSGRTVGRFRIVSQLGKGGMGVVYAAEDPELDRKVALKLVRPRQRGSRVRLQARLQREARALGRLTHPNVVRVYDVGSDGDELFVAMEMVDGPTLLEWQSERERSLDELLAVYLQAAAGLAAAHDALLVHRDFKPENVFVTSNGRVLVGDFGLANLEDAVATTADDDSGTSSSGLTEAGTLLGTLGYMAPEQLRGELVDARADQFAFCVALWEAITGERPFVGNNTEALLAAIDAGKLRLAERVPRRLRTVLRRGLSYHRDARFAELRELTAAIESAGDRRPYWGIGLAASAAVVAAALWLREAPATCEQRERIDRVWAEGHEALAERLSLGSAEVLEDRADKAVEHLRARADSVCREPSANRQRVLERTIDEFSTAIAKPEALTIDGWVALIESLETLDLDRPAIDPEVAVAVDRSRMHEWYGESAQAWTAANEAVALAFSIAPSGWSPSASEALVQRGRLLKGRAEYEQALDDFASAEAHAEGSDHGAQVLRARLEAASVLTRYVQDISRAELALTKLEPALDRHSRPLSPDHALAHELHSMLAALRGEVGACIGHSFTAAFIHVVVHPDPVATARSSVSLGVALSQLGLEGSEQLYARAAELLGGEVAATHAVRLNIAYNQALIDIEADDAQRRMKGRATLEWLHRHADSHHRILAAQALLYLALQRDDVTVIRALVQEIELTPEGADNAQVLLGKARLAAESDSLARVRARHLERGDVLTVSNLEYELAVSLQLATCELAQIGVARVDRIESKVTREQSRADFERLLASLHCD